MIRASGGTHGGGSQLTDYGRELVQLYRLLQNGYERVMTQMQAQVHDLDKLNELIRAITMKTSARNQLRGSVVSVQPGAVNADVVLDVGEGLEICANITNDAVDDLRLVTGRSAVALIKANFVSLTTAISAPTDVRNRLPGVVAQVTAGAINHEVKVELAGGRVLTAVVSTEAWAHCGLAVGMRCTGLIHAANVLIAVND